MTGLASLSAKVALAVSLLLGCAAHEVKVRAPRPEPEESLLRPKALATEAPAVAARAPRSVTVPVSRLPLRSVGNVQGGVLVLEENGFVGAYLRLERAARVELGVTARGFSDQTSPSRMRIAVADHARAFELGPSAGTSSAAFELPVGVHLLRIEFVNGLPDVTRELHLRELSVKGAELVLDHTDQLALAAADSYVEHFRRGKARVRVAGLVPGTRVRARLSRHEFDFGTNIPFAENKLILEGAEPQSDAAKYQRFIFDNFNTVVLSNGGKWVFNEPAPGRVTTDYLDRFFAFAREHGLRARMHTMLWGNQQPEWVVAPADGRPGLLDRARKGDARAKAELERAIAKRIDYYVRERAQHYHELDVVNESVHRAEYLEAFGIDGLARFYQATKAAAIAAGSTTKLCLNEYNVVQWSRDPMTDALDNYANWYRRHADRLLVAGAPIDCLGVQYYVDGRGADRIGTRAHSAARIAQALYNLSTTGASLTLTEFSILREADAPRAAQILEETLRIVFGTPSAEGFLIWAIWAGAANPVPVSILYDLEGNLTALGERYQALQRAWRTDLELPVAADGSIEFVGFYGDYELSAPGFRQTFTHGKPAAN